MSADSFEHIPAYFPQLRKLHLGTFTPSLSLHVDMFIVLTKLEHLTELSIAMLLEKEDTCDHDSFVHQLKLYPSLKSLSFHGISDTSYIPLIFVPPILTDKLEHISFFALSICNEDAAALASSLQEHRCSLKTLTIVKCRCEKFVLSLLAKGIRSNKSVHKFIV